MIKQIRMKLRGPAPGMAKREFNALAKESWGETGKFFHASYTHKRFTVDHARAAKYGKRKGEGLSRGSRAFRRSYYGKKLRSERGGGVGQALPLVNTGETRRASRIPSIRATKSGLKIRYKVRKLNLRHPNSRIRMAKEFRTILPAERKAIVQRYDQELERRLNAVTATRTVVIN